MSKDLRVERLLKVKLATLESADQWGNVSKACRAFGVSRAAFYRWRETYTEFRIDGLKQLKPIAKDHPRRIPEATVAKVLPLRKSYQLGPQRIIWYMERYHGITIAFSSVYRIRVRNGVSRLPGKSARRALHTHRYAKSVPGHPVQMDVKIWAIATTAGAPVRRYQYTAVDDATRIRARMIYPSRTQKNAIAFFDYVAERFPIRIHTTRTDRGHEWQAQFHWHVEDHGVRHVYIKPRSPQLNGKVERSHRTDREEFDQLLAYTDDVDLLKKLAAWEQFYNLSRPHGAHGGKTSYAALQNLLVYNQTVSAG